MSEGDFQILAVAQSDVVGDEQLGSKEKFWFRRDGKLWLFKEARFITTPGGSFPTGEDWAEKVAAEIAYTLNIRAATVELAEFKGKRGCASLNFTTRAQQLMHGNEVMAGNLDGYDREIRRPQADHTVENIVRAIRTMFPEQSTEHRAVLQHLASYLVLDALIGNTDRHHENWGLLWQVRVDIDEVTEAGRLSKEYDVAPTFDHASSLGRELLDETRLQHMERQTVEKYLRAGRGGVFRPGGKHGESPLRLVELTAREYPDYFRPTLATLSNTPLAQLTGFVDRVPDERITAPARAFAKAVLGVAYDALRRIFQ